MTYHDGFDLYFASIFLNNSLFCFHFDSQQYTALLFLQHLTHVHIKEQSAPNSTALLDQLQVDSAFG